MSSAAEPYERLAVLAEHELELVARRAFAELAKLHEVRDALVRSLPPTPPSCARTALQRAAILQRRVSVELHRVREQILLELAQVERARRAATGYATPHRHVATIQARA